MNQPACDDHRNFYFPIHMSSLVNIIKLTVLEFHWQQRCFNSGRVFSKIPHMGTKTATPNFYQTTLIVAYYVERCFLSANDRSQFTINIDHLKLQPKILVFTFKDFILYWRVWLQAQYLKQRQKVTGMMIMMIMICRKKELLPLSFLASIDSFFFFVHSLFTTSTSM